MNKLNRDVEGKPIAPRRDWQMTANGNGQWSKKFAGKVYYFGAWDDWREAEKDYNWRWPSITAGHGDPKAVEREEKAAAAGVITDCDFHTVANLYVAGKLVERNALKIGSPHYDAICREIKFLLDFAPKGTPWRHAKVSSKRPTDWALLAAKLEDNFGPDARKRMIGIYHSLSGFGAKNGYCPAFQFGEELIAPGKGEVRQARRRREKQRGPKLYPREQILPILSECRTFHLRAMFLLGINAGFTAADCGALPIDALDFNRGIFDYDRVKTGVQRAGFLWPETMEALQKSIADRPAINVDKWKAAIEAWKATKPNDGKEAIKRWERAEPKWDRLVFITRFGTPWVRQHQKDAGSGKSDTIRQDAIGLEFRKVLEACDCNYPKGLGGWHFKREDISFGALRHTFYSAARVIDPDAAQFIQGHTGEGMGEWYDHMTPEKWQKLAYVAEGVYTALMLPQTNEGTMTLAGAFPRLRLPGSGTAASKAEAV